MKLSSPLLLGVGLFVAGAGSLYLLQQTCRPKPTHVEARVDSVLVQDTTVHRVRLELERKLAAREKIIAAEKAATARQKHLADSSQALADSLTDWANHLGEVPLTLPVDEQNTRLRLALAAQKEAMVQFQITNGALGKVIASQGAVIALQDTTIADQRQGLRRAYGRIDTLTKDLGDLREETRNKGRWNLLGIHLPGWTKSVAYIAGAGYAGWRIGKGS